jgi:histidyl-tRNA synthetase
MELSLGREGALDVYVVVAKEERRPDALEQVQRLREHKLRVDYPLAPAKVGKQFQAAEQMGARLAVLIGDEWPNIAVKDLRTGEQQLVEKDQLLERIASVLK